MSNTFERNNIERVIQEYVPGRQITIAHVIANPVDELYQKLGLVIGARGAIGIMTITPSEASMIAADIATKTSNVSIGFIDRFSGSLVLLGAVSDVEEALKEVIRVFENNLNFTTTNITKS